MPLESPLRRRAAARLAIVVTAVVLAPLGLAPGKDAPSPAQDPALSARMDEAVQRASGGAFWGVVLAAKGGKVVFAKGYGEADYRERRNVPDSLFEIASASKQVTATAILRLEQQKRLRTSDGLDRFFKGVPADKRGITVDRLLHHTSGISGDAGVPYAWQGTRDAYVAQMLAAPLSTEPGTKFEYANAGYALLAAIVEVASGRDFEDYVRKELFAPAGMADTGFVGDPRLVRSDRVTRRSCDDCDPSWTAANWYWGWGYRGMGGVVTTAPDLAAWDRALRGDKILGPAAQKKLLTPDKEGYACGWVVAATDRGTTKAHHGGGVRGYACQIARYLEDDAFVAVLSNGRTDPSAVERAVSDVLFPPARITLDIDVGGLPLSPFRAYETKDATWAVSTEKGALVLALTVRGRAVATVRGPAALRAKIASDLEQALSSSTFPEPDQPSATEGGVYLGMFADGAARQRVEEGLAIKVLPRYEGRGSDGAPVEDPRAVLLVESSSPVFGWPVMTKLNPNAARALAAALRGK